MADEYNSMDNSRQRCFTKSTHVFRRTTGYRICPLAFLLNINAMNEDKGSHVKLFADDCLLLKTTKNIADTLALQYYLSQTSVWADKWQITFIPENSYTHLLQTNCNPLIVNYQIKELTLKFANHHPCLGVELQRYIKWKPHINNITSEENITIGLIKRNLNRCSQEVKIIKRIIICLRYYYSAI